MSLRYLIALLLFAYGVSSVAVAQDSSAMDEENAALFMEALGIQGLLAPEIGARDVNDGQEFATERNTRMPDALSGDWHLYAPGGTGFYWSSDGRISTVNNYRAGAALGLDAGKIWGFIRQHGHASVADVFAGYQLVESDHIWYGGGINEIASTGLSGSYFKHDVNRGLSVPALPEYDAEHFKLSYMSDYCDGIEWRADYHFDTFTSAPLGFDGASANGFKFRADYRFDEQWRVRGDYMKRWQDAASGLENDLTADEVKLGVKYGGPGNPWFGGFDLRSSRYTGSPILNTHLDEGRKYSAYFGWKSDSVVRKLQVGYEAAEWDLSRLMLEDPGFSQIKTRLDLTASDLAPFIRPEEPKTDKWYVDAEFGLGQAKLTGKYSRQTTDDTATSATPTAGALQPILPQTQDSFRASLWVPFSDVIDLTLGEWYRESTTAGGASDVSENIVTADLSWGIFQNHSISIGGEFAEWDQGFGGTQGSSSGISQDTWRFGWAGDFGSFKADVAYSKTEADSGAGAMYNGDWNTISSRLNFDVGGFPVTLGAEFFDSNLDFVPNFNSEGFRIFLKTVWEF
ncbi:MAG: hypothetical protein HRF49_04810 [bacterium]|jgi:hypothetical protein